MNGDYAGMRFGGTGNVRWVGCSRVDIGSRGPVTSDEPCGLAVQLEIEDDRGGVERGKDALRAIERQWRFGGAYVDDMGRRREAFNVMLSMPRGAYPQAELSRPWSSRRSNSPTTSA